MPFDANGNFSLVPGTIVADGLNILPSQHNPPFQDVANGLSQVVVRDGRAPMTGPLNMNGYKITGVAAGDAPTDVVTNERIADLGVAIGDGAWSLRDLSPNWLRRDGKLYLRANYPDLADLLPPLPDGIIWENLNSGVTTTIWSSFLEDGLGLLGSTSGIILRSTDLTTWTAVDAGSSLGSVNEILRTPDGLLAIGSAGRVSLSQDGFDWDNRLVASSFVATSAHYHDGVYLICGRDSTSNGRLYKSTDLASWTQVAPTTGIIQGIAHDGTTWVIVARSGAIFTSPDATTWTSRTSGTTSDLFSVKYGGDKFVAVGAGGTIITSANGVSWTTRTSGTAQTLNSVSFDDFFIAVGAQGVATYSSDGATWTTSISGSSGEFYKASLNGPVALVSGASGRAMTATRTSPTQFRVPNDDPTYGWIRAL